MSDGDFYSSEKSTIVEAAGDVRIELVAADGQVTVLKEKTPVQVDEVIDAAVMNCSALREFFDKETKAARNDNVLLSLHLKATMMKVSDPIMFGHAVTVYYRDVFEKHAALFAELGVDENNGIGDVYAKIAALPDAQKAEIEADIQAVYGVPPCPRDGRFGQRHYESSCAKQCDHRRVDACVHSNFGANVGTGWTALRHAGNDSRPLLRRHLSGSHLFL